MSKTIFGRSFLTKADKRRIEEEEKYRTEVRNRTEVRSDSSEAPKQKTKPEGCGTGCWVVLIVFAALGAIFYLFDKMEEEGKPSPSPVPVMERDFKASVSFSGTQFVITNLDDLDCQSAKMEINGGIFKGGYILEGYTLEAGKTYKVGALQFTKKDGTRFNPFETKPKDFFIFCRGGNALWGASWLGNFK